MSAMFSTRKPVSIWKPDSHTYKDLPYGAGPFSFRFRKNAGKTIVQYWYIPVEFAVKYEHYAKNMK